MREPVAGRKVQMMRRTKRSGPLTQRGMSLIGLLAWAIIIGFVGFLMRRYDIPVAPVLVGMILGPLSEQQFRRALAISQGDLSIFVTQPISAVVFAITALVLIVPPIWRHVGRMRATAIGHPHHN